MSSIVPSKTKFLVALGLLAGLCSAPVLAQSTQPSADEIMQKALDAGGGAEAAKKLTTRVTTGTMKIPAANLNGTIKVVQKGKLGLLTIDLAGIGKILRGYDGTTAWESNAMQGSRIIEGAEKEELVRQFDLQSDVDWKDNYTKAEVVGTESVGDAKTYKVALTSKAGTSETRFYDTTSYILLKTISTTTSPQGPVEVTTLLTDYRDVDGIKVPFKATASMMNMQQIIAIDKIQHGVDIPDADLALPAEIKELAAAKAKEVKP